MKKALVLVGGFFILISLAFTSPKFQASSVDNLKRATAKEIGADTRTDDVSISNVKRKATSVKWYAKVKDVCYECDADDMVRTVHIVKIDCALVPDNSKDKKK
jgi:hypothetical protein